MTEVYQVKLNKLGCFGLPKRRHRLITRRTSPLSQNRQRNPRRRFPMRTSYFRPETFGTSHRHPLQPIGILLPCRKRHRRQQSPTFQ